VDAREYARPPRHAVESRIVDLDGIAERGFRVQSHLDLHIPAPLRVDEVAVSRRVNLDVLNALLRERPHFPRDHGRTIPQELGIATVHRVRDSLLESNRRELIGAWQGHFDVAGAVRLQECDLMSRHSALAPNLPCRDAKFRHSGAAPLPLDGVSVGHAVNSLVEVGHKCRAP
jgi:hypothetical protein